MSCQLFTDVAGLTLLKCSVEMKINLDFVCFYFRRNVFHAALTIAKRDGVLALQKGLAPALCYQFVMNGVRLGTYQLADKQGWTRKKMTGQGNPVSIVAIGAFAGSVASVVASPLYLVRRMLSTF